MATTRRTSAPGGSGPTVDQRHEAEERRRVEAENERLRREIEALRRERQRGD
jgi:hypothetical protein